MFLCNNNIKMKVNKLVRSYSGLVKFRSSYNVKLFIGTIHMQSFSFSSDCFKDKIEGDELKPSCRGIEQIRALQAISKKRNQLSRVEEKDIGLLDELKKGNLYAFKSTQEKLKKSIVEDVKLGVDRTLYFLTKVKSKSLEQGFFKNHTDILIIGGGAVGLSIAYAIRSQFPHGPKVLVVDKDGSCPHLSTNLGQGIVSLQLFSEEEEISILKYGAEFFSAFTRSTEILDQIKFTLDYDPLGSLQLVDNSNIEQIIKNQEKLKIFGINNYVVDKKMLRKKFPWLNVENILFGSLGTHREGIINPWTYIYGLKCKCLSLGVDFVTAEIIDFGFERDSIRRAICKLPDGSYNFINFAYCVIAGGIESLNIVNLFNQAQELLFGLKLPLEERMRYEYCFYTPEGPGLNTPAIINPDGTYFRREGLTGHYVAGVPSVVNNDEVKEDEPFHIFENVVKPFLTNRMPDLKNIDLITGWIDVYDFCISNKVGITGPHPNSNRIIFALGFSHLGLQYLPGLGRAVMEYLIYDDYQTINFEPFHIENLWRKQHLEADKKRRELLEAQQNIAVSE